MSCIPASIGHIKIKIKKHKHNNKIIYLEMLLNLVFQFFFYFFAEGNSLSFFALIFNGNIEWAGVIACQIIFIVWLFFSRMLKQGELRGW